MKPVLVSRKTVACLLLAALFAACNVTNKEQKLLNTGKLPISEYTIDITRDTMIHTTRGAIINIPANSIEAKEKQITLQIKEAFSIADIIAAGPHHSAAEA